MDEVQVAVMADLAPVPRRLLREPVVREVQVCSGEAASFPHTGARLEIAGAIPASPPLGSQQQGSSRRFSEEPFWLLLPLSPAGCNSLETHSGEPVRSSR